MSDERLPKIACIYKTNWKRKQGRPQKKWINGIKKWMRDKGLAKGPEEMEPLT